MKNYNIINKLRYMLALSTFITIICSCHSSLPTYGGTTFTEVCILFTIYIQYDFRAIDTSVTWGSGYPVKGYYWSPVPSSGAYTTSVHTINRYNPPTCINNMVAISSYTGMIINHHQVFWRNSAISIGI